MINKIGFVLGREAVLSVAEISAVLVRKKIPFRFYYYKSPILIIESDQEIDLVIDELGGTVKIFDISAETQDILGAIKQLEPKQTERRINFGLSFYGVKPAKYLGQELKKYYKNQGLAARHVVGRSPDLSSVIVNENRLIERGFEALVIKKEKSFVIGRTREVQDYKAYSRRDFGRPYRDDASGMLPPKLAKIMVNLAAKDNSAVLYDPFCGSGTVIQEALLLGYKNLFASDISDRAIADTRANIAWLEQIGFSKSNNLEIFRNDATKTDKPLKGIDAIVSEGYLGQPINRNRERAAQDSEELTDFYFKVLKNLHKFLPPDGILVLAIPFFIVENKKYFLRLSEHLSELGFNFTYPPLPDCLHCKTLTYSRPDQHVGREILVLSKK